MSSLTNYKRRLSWQWKLSVWSPNHTTYDRQMWRSFILHPDPSSGGFPAKDGRERTNSPIQWWHMA